MAKVKLVDVMTEVLWERCLLNQRSIQLEHSLTPEQKTHGIFKEYASFLRKTSTSEQMSMIQRVFAPTIAEAGIEMSDDELADIIAQAAQELQSKIPDAKYLTDPDKLDVDALMKGDAEHGIQTESYNRSKQLLLEVDPLTVLAGPSILKLIAEIIEWCKRTFGKSTEGEQQALIFLDLIYKRAKNKPKQIPSISQLQELAHKKSWFGKGASIADAYKLSGDKDTEKAILKDIRRAFQKISQAVDAENDEARKKGEHGIHFDPAGKEAQPVDKHMLHILFDLTYSSKGAKVLANWGHTMHEYILKVVTAVLTPIFAAKYGLFKKESWKKAWSKAESVANGTYIICMLVVLGVEALHHFAHTPSIMEMINRLFGSSDQMLTAATNVTKAGDLTATGVEEFLAASSVAGDS